MINAADQIRDIILAPALVATLPGLWALARKRVVLGVALALVGFVLLGIWAVVCVGLGFVARNDLLLVVTWAGVAVFCAVGAWIVMSATPTGSAGKAPHDV